ncbi:MAG: acetyltransferase [Zetaproteobacteria bacterium]|nr:MAG: acetyltransferase [Zetaproteobacteria bacterium]
MAHIDVFNGDADGLCALHQLRLHEPIESELVTGVKRDIALLNRVHATHGDHVTVLDISFDKNRPDVERLLSAGAEITYFDHHFSGDVPVHPGLRATIDTSPDVCTSLLVDAHLHGAFRPWAVVAAFGDNLFDAARRAAVGLELSGEGIEQLRHLGTLINYNSYGATLDDLHFHPARLYRSMAPFADPFDFMRESRAYAELDAGYREDIERVQSLVAEFEDHATAMYVLPDAAWARRISGVFANELARTHPRRAHALATEMPDGSYRISVRAPLATKTGADVLCRQFPTGGGRQAAAGINALPKDMFSAFIQAFRRQFSN